MPSFLTTKQIHYAWVIVAIAAAMGFITSAVRFASAALVPHLSDPNGDFGWSYGEISLAFSLQWVVLGLVSPYVGLLGDRYGVRWLLLAGGLLFIAGMMLTGVMSSLWQFYLYFGVVLGDRDHHLHRADGFRRHPVVQETPGRSHGGGVVLPGGGHHRPALLDRGRLQPARDAVDFLAAWDSRRSDPLAAGQVLSQRARRHRPAAAG